MSLKAIPLPKRSKGGKTKTKGKTMSKKKTTTKRRKAPAKTRARARKSFKGKKSRVTLYKRSGKYYAPRKAGRYAPTLAKGIRINPSRKRRRIRRNPSFSLKKVLNTKLLINGSLVAGGFIAGAYIAQKLREVLPVSITAPLGRFSGALNIVAGLLTASFVKNEKAKMVALGMVGSGAYDIMQQLLPATMTTPSITPAVQGLGVDTSLMGADTSLLGMEFEDDLDEVF